MNRSHRVVAALCLAAACRRTSEPPAHPAVGDASVSRDVAMDVLHDVVIPHDATPAPVLTIRVLNVGSQPLVLMTNPDTNEVLHTRHLYSRRQPDAATYAASEGELTKFFTVGQEPLCSDDGGAGYGGLGQTGNRTLAVGESMSFAWDGHVRREVIDAQRGGACVNVVEPGAGRYRLEFDQPYNPPMCNRPVVTLPLAADAPREITIRCTPRPPGHEES